MRKATEWIGVNLYEGKEEKGSQNFLVSKYWHESISVLSDSSHFNYSNRSRIVPAGIEDNKAEVHRIHIRRNQNDK